MLEGNLRFVLLPDMVFEQIMFEKRNALMMGIEIGLVFGFLILVLVFTLKGG